MAVSAHPENQVAAASARQMFVDTSVPLGKRFAQLVALANRGDKAAAHFAVQIANECASVASVSAAQPAPGKTQVSDDQTQSFRQIESACAAVRYSPSFANLQQWLQSYPVDSLDGPLMAAIEERSAALGAPAGLSAAIGVIIARPDETTAMAVAKQLAKLDLTSVYQQSGLHFMTSLPPSQRDTLMRYALGLLACYYGRPCGPDSFAVRSTCFALGACLPAADLPTVVERKLLDKVQAAQVRDLLAYLQQFTATPIIER